MSGSSDRIRRFERLERPRREGPDGEERPSAAERIEGVEGELARSRAPAEGAPPTSAGERFAPPRERPPDVAAPDAGDQPFIRCQRCEADSSRYATRCANCGEDLRTEAQVAFNRGLWEERRRERGRLEAEAAGREATREAAEAEEALARRRAAEEMAREVGERERARLEAEGLGGGLGGWMRRGIPRDPDGADGGLLRALADLLFGRRSRW